MQIFGQNRTIESFKCVLRPLKFWGWMIPLLIFVAFVSLLPLQEIKACDFITSTLATDPNTKTVWRLISTTTPDINNANSNNNKFVDAHNNGSFNGELGWDQGTFGANRWLGLKQDWGNYNNFDLANNHNNSFGLQFMTSGADISADSVMVVMWNFQNSGSDGANMQVYYEYNGGTRRLHFYTFDETNAYEATYNITLGVSVSHQLIGVIDDSLHQVRWYLDGAQVATVNGLNWNRTETGKFTLGYESSGFIFRDVWVMGRQLTDTEIDDLFNNNTTVCPSPAASNFIDFVARPTSTYDFTTWTITTTAYTVAECNLVALLFPNQISQWCTAVVYYSHGGHNYQAGKIITPDEINAGNISISKPIEFSAGDVINAHPSLYIRNELAALSSTWTFTILTPTNTPSAPAWELPNMDVTNTIISTTSLETLRGNCENSFNTSTWVGSIKAALICDAGRLFIFPSDNAWNYLRSPFEALSIRPPLGYASVYLNAMRDMVTPTTTVTSTIETAPISSDAQKITVVIMWLLAVIYMIKRVIHIKI